ncbi:MAG: ABC transporter permease, partial [Bacteroidota bacterium]|nr:ABC transporter permease [Bacteroidota bacterium]
MQFSDTFSLAYRTVKSNRLRTGITVTIIALGITALIGIITAITSMDQSLKENFALMGANSFSIHYQNWNIRIGGRRQVHKTKVGALKQRSSNATKKITYQEARLFKERYDFPALVTITLSGPQNIIVSNEKVKTNPNVGMQGGDENYLTQSGYSLEAGRNFNKIDIE